MERTFFYVPLLYDKDKKSRGREFRTNERRIGRVTSVVATWAVDREFVHDTLNEGKEATQYTSTLKLMQLMADKGMLGRDETNMKHVYYPLLEERGTKGHLLSKFIDTMYHGSVENMMVALLGNEKTSKEDLKKIKELLSEMEKKR